MKFKLRSSVSVVDSGNNILEFFKTSTRQSVKIKTKDDLIKKLVLSLDGERDFDEICSDLKINSASEQLKSLISFLEKKAVLSHDDLLRGREDYIPYGRVIHFLEDYSESDEEMLEIWERVRNSRVVIIGLGAVGTWLAVNLAQSGVRNFVFIDNDKVELSNLHRQLLFYESDIGRQKTDVVKERLCFFEEDVSVDSYNMFLEDGVLEKVSGKVDLVINCADKPSVDETSRIVGRFCMKKKIPHIVGGGYNLHLSLIGQTVIPYESACVNCFERQLVKINDIEGKRIKKLNIKNRKIGSFGPMCSLIASMVGMEAIKVLSGKIKPDNINRRGEFNIYDMGISYKDFDKLDDCEWCGEGR